MKFTPVILMAASLCSLSFNSCQNDKTNVEETQPRDEVILHAWSWSFDTIAANMQNHFVARLDFFYICFVVLARVE